MSASKVTVSNAERYSSWKHASLFKTRSASAKAEGCSDGRRPCTCELFMNRYGTYFCRVVMRGQRWVPPNHVAL